MRALIVLLLLSIIVIKANADNCNENPCVFPFNFGGQVFTTCTNFGFLEPWCSTMNDEDGQMVNWRLCGECEGMHNTTITRVEVVNDVCEENPCAFPFTFGSQEFDTCTDFGFDQMWCSTLNDENGEMVEWKICDECDIKNFFVTFCQQLENGQQACIRLFLPPRCKPTGPSVSCTR